MNSSHHYYLSSYLVALKQYNMRYNWYRNAAEIEVQLHKRFSPRNATLSFIDSSTIVSYQVPHKDEENMYCQGEYGDDKWEW